MAAIDLQRSLEHGGHHVWGPERPHDTMDAFDSEIQDWEDQLHDMQRKIEELYNEVQARRGGSEVAGDNDNNNQRNGLGPGSVTVPNHHGNGCSRALSHHQKNGYGVSQIGDLLQDYLGQGNAMDRKNSNRARRVHFDQTVRVSQDPPAYQAEMNRGPEIERMSQEHFPGSCEDAENRKNRAALAKSHPGKEGSPNKENTGATKPPLRQREAVPAGSPPRAQLLSDSPAPDRKCFSPGALADRKCGSPSVLRKFGAMLQENEGKTLTDTGVVPSGSSSSTPSCQRRALGATAAAPPSAGRAPAAATRVPTHRCQAVDSDALTAAPMEPGQEWGSLIDSGRHAEQQTKGPQPNPLHSQRRAAQVAGSPKLRPRANSGADRDTGRRSAAAQPNAEPRADYRALNGQRMQRAAGQSGCGRAAGGRDDGLIELLDMLDIQHEYGSSSSSPPRGGGGHTTSHRQDSQSQQGSPDESSPSASRKCFSRPARPANQRPPSRWAAGRCPAPSGPMYRPPSPLARPPSPMTRSPSPARKQQQPVISYRLHTETVIM